MKLITGTILIFCTSLLIFSCKQDPCTTKDGFLASFETFKTEFEEKHEGLDDEAKEAYELRFQGIVNNCYKKFKPELSLKEKQDFWKGALQFYMTRFDGDFDLDFGSEMEDPFNQYVKDEVMEVVKASGAEFLVSIQEVFEVHHCFSTDVFRDSVYHKRGQ